METFSLNLPHCTATTRSKRHLFSRQFLARTNRKSPLRFCRSRTLCFISLLSASVLSSALRPFGINFAVRVICRYVQRRNQTSSSRVPVIIILINCNNNNNKQDDGDSSWRPNQTPAAIPPLEVSLWTIGLIIQCRIGYPKAKMQLLWKSLERLPRKSW